MPPKSKFSFLTGLFLICMCGLMLQIIETEVPVGHFLLLSCVLCYRHGDVRHDGGISCLLS